MHLLGLMGMPRRVYTYPPGLGWERLNQVATAGSVVAIGGGLLFVVNALWSYWRGRPAGADPWDAATLEWASPSPVPSFNLPHTPVVDSLTPLWREGPLPVMDGVATDRREVLITSVVDAAPLYRQKNPGPSIWPLLAALATSAMFVGSIFTPWAVAIGAVPIAVGLVGWFWPASDRTQEATA